MCTYTVLAALLFFAPVKAAHAFGLYDFIPYSDPLCGCDPDSVFPVLGGCCIAAGDIMNEEIAGGGIWILPDLQNDYYIDDLYADFRDDLKKMTNDLVSDVMSGTAIEMADIDAKNLMTSTLAVQKENTKTFEQYQPSETICRFGTLSRSMASSEKKADIAKIGLATQAIQRQMLRAGTNAGSAYGDQKTIGEAADKIGRWDQFSEGFCDIMDSNGYLAEDDSDGNPICSNTDDTQVNRDVNFSRTLDIPRTLDIEFSSAGAGPTLDEESVMALANNLYAQNLITNLGASDIDSIKKGKASAIEKFFDYRSLVAKRSVAENSFATIASLKAAGDGSSAPYMKEVIRKLGIADDADIEAYLGENPSYYAQMEVLTKKIYQDPAFYANLMDSPANVTRQQTAMKAIAVAQDRDIYESMRRSEMLLSGLLELYVQREQDSYADKGRK